MNFVKPNAVKPDPRVQEEKDRELAQKTSDNLFHIQKQLHAHGHSLEAVLAVAAKNAYGVDIQPHVPVKADEQKAA